MTRSMISSLFYLAAFYDGVLGIVLLIVPARIYVRFAVTPPNHWGYVQFPAALLIVFALMFLAVARDPESNRNLIPYGLLLKVSYCGVVFSYWIAQGIPSMWKPLAIMDLGFAALFLWASASLRRLAPTDRSATA
jgi:hypothetical protein